MTLLRTVQGVRLRGAAHRKGRDYDLSQAGLDPHDFFASFKVLLQRSTEALRGLTEFATSQSR